jgi:hypothetical protein
MILFGSHLRVRCRPQELCLYTLHQASPKNKDVLPNDCKINKHKSYFSRLDSLIEQLLHIQHSLNLLVGIPPQSRTSLSPHPNLLFCISMGTQDFFIQHIIIFWGSKYPNFGQQRAFKLDPLSFWHVLINLVLIKVPSMISAIEILILRKKQLQLSISYSHNPDHFWHQVEGFPYTSSEQAML